jgi:Replicase family
MLSPALAPSSSYWNCSFSEGVSPLALARARKMQEPMAASSPPERPPGLAGLADIGRRHGAPGLKQQDPLLDGIVRPPRIPIGNEPQNIPADRSMLERMTPGVFIVDPVLGGAQQVLAPLEGQSPNEVAAAFLAKFERVAAAKAAEKLKKAEDKARRERERRDGLNPQRTRKKSKRTLEKERAREEHLASLDKWDREKYLKAESEKAEKKRARQREIMLEQMTLKEAHKARIRGGQHISGVVANHRYPAMTERFDGALWRSQLRIPNLALMVAGTPKHAAHRSRRDINGLGLRGGDRKDNLQAARSSLLGRDAAYIQGHKHHIHWIAQDLDDSFAGIGALMQLLNYLLPPEFLPNLIVGRAVDGVITRPHLIWLLPPGASIWNNLEDPRCQRKPIALLKRIQLGLCERLAELGADPGMMHAGRIKNPLSAAWSTFCVHDAWQSLDAWKNATIPMRDAEGNIVRRNDDGKPVTVPLLNLKVRRDEIDRKCALASAPKGSNGIYNSMTPILAEFMKAQQIQRNPAFLDAWETDDPYAFRDWMFPLVRPAIVEAVGGGPHIDRILMARCRATRHRVWKLNWRKPAKTAKPAKSGKQGTPAKPKKKPAKTAKPVKSGKQGTPAKPKKMADRGRDADRIVFEDVFSAARLQVLPPEAKKPGRMVAGKVTRENQKKETVDALVKFLVETRPTTRQSGIKAAIAAKVKSQSVVYTRYDKAAEKAAPLIAEAEAREKETRSIRRRIKPGIDYCSEAEIMDYRGAEIMDYRADSWTVPPDKKPQSIYQIYTGDTVDPINHQPILIDNGHRVWQSDPHHPHDHPSDWSDQIDRRRGVCATRTTEPHFTSDEPSACEAIGVQASGSKGSNLSDVQPPASRRPAFVDRIRRLTT